MLLMFYIVDQNYAKSKNRGDMYFSISLDILLYSNKSQEQKQFFIIHLNQIVIKQWNSWAFL